MGQILSAAACTRVGVSCRLHGSQRASRACRGHGAQQANRDAVVQGQGGRCPLVPPPFLVVICQRRRSMLLRLWRGSFLPCRDGPAAWIGLAPWPKELRPPPAPKTERATLRKAGRPQDSLAQPRRGAPVAHRDPRKPGLIPPNERPESRRLFGEGLEQGAPAPPHVRRMDSSTVPAAPQRMLYVPGCSWRMSAPQGPETKRYA